MIKLFLIGMLGSYSGSSMLLPGSAYSLEGGIQRGAFRASIDMTYIGQETKYPQYKAGSASLMPIMAVLTMSPKIRSRVRPYIGIGYGYVVTGRDVEGPTDINGWRTKEEIENGPAFEFKGGIEVALTKSTSIVLGMKQIFFETKIKETRRNMFTYRDEGSQFVKYSDVSLSMLLANFGVKYSF